MKSSESISIMPIEITGIANYIGFSFYLADC